MLDFYSLMTFLQLNSKQAWNSDHNIGFFVAIIQLVASTKMPLRVSVVNFSFSNISRVWVSRILVFRPNRHSLLSQSCSNVECWTIRCNVGLLERGTTALVKVRSRVRAETFMEVSGRTSVHITLVIRQSDLLFSFRTFSFNCQ